MASELEIAFNLDRGGGITQPECAQSFVLS